MLGNEKIGSVFLALYLVADIVIYLSPGNDPAITGRFYFVLNCLIKLVHTCLRFFSYLYHFSYAQCSLGRVYGSAFLSPYYTIFRSLFQLMPASYAWLSQFTRTFSFGVANGISIVM